MVRFIDTYRKKFGVEPICAVLPIAPSMYYELKARARDPHRRPVREQPDAMLIEHVGRVWRENREVYGVRKVWKQLTREGYPVARCTVARLMRRLGLAGVVRGRRFTVTTRPETATALPPDLVTRQFRAQRPNALLGGRSDVCRHVAWVCVRSVRHRRVLAPDRRLAGIEFARQRCKMRSPGVPMLEAACAVRR
jgi:transposase InsO family protein